MKRAVFPGSFNPVTVGHLDLIKRAANLCDELLVAVMINESKKSSFLTFEDRVELLKEVTSDIKNVKVCSHKGLLADFVKKENIDVIIRGVRSVSDYEYEFNMAQTNAVLTNGVDTVFLATSPKYSYISSSMVREVAAFGGDISDFVPGDVLTKYL